MRNSRELRTATRSVESAMAAMPADLHEVRLALADLDELLGSLSGYSRRLSSAVEKLPDGPELHLDHPHGPVAPEVVCNHVASHLQAAAAGIDQTRTAVGIAGRLSEQLRDAGAE